MTTLTKTSEKYFRIRLSHVFPNQQELLTALCFDYHSTGSSEALQYLQPDLTYDPYIVEAKRHEIDVFFAEPPPEDFFKRINEQFPNILCKSHEEESKDWLEEWKKGYDSFQLAGQYWVVPSWKSSPTDPHHTIFIDPGMAFGTGTHPTTKMASYFVLKATESFSENERRSLLDVGTGTGILAMLASRQAVRNVKGVEIDPEARRVARANVENNQLTKIEIPEVELEEVKGQFQFVVANIIDGVLVKIKDSLLARLESNGHIFLTGILLEREERFYEDFFKDTNLKIVRRIQKDEWVGYWAKHETVLD